MSLFSLGVEFTDREEDEDDDEDHCKTYRASTWHRPHTGSPSAGVECSSTNVCCTLSLSQVKKNFSH